MTKEAAKVIKRVKSDDLPNIVTKVKVNNRKEFTSCFEKIRAGCPETVVMVMADSPITKNQKANIMWVAAYVPERAKDQLQEWLNNSIKDVISDGAVTSREISESSTIVEITYPDESESVPFLRI